MTFPIPGEQAGVGGAFQLSVIVVINLEPHLGRKYEAVSFKMLE